MALLKYSRFGTNRHAIRSNTASPLTDEQLRLAIPSLFAAEKHESRSERFTYVPTIDVLTKLRAEGFEPYSACQTRSRDDGQLAFTKHMLRLRRVDFSQSRDEVPEVIVLNSHNGSSSYQMMAGIFRFVCANGLISADESTQEIRVRHKGDIVGEVIEGAYRVVQDFETVQASIEKMKAVKLLPEELHMFASSALALRWPNGAAPIDTVRAPEQLAALVKMLHLIAGFGCWPRNGRGLFNMSKLMTAAKQFPDQLTRLQAYADGLNARIKLLAKMGAIGAKEYWRDGKYLILVTPSVRGRRERPFIGKDPEKIKEARAKIARHAEMVALSALARDTDAFMRDVERSIIGLHAELQTYTYSKTVPPWDSKSKGKK